MLSNTEQQVQVGTAIASAPPHTAPCATASAPAEASERKDWVVSEALSLVAEKVSAWYGDHQGINEISMTFRANQVTALIGPSGCGKSTFLRCLNRMHEMTPGRPRVEGKILLDGQDIYGKKVDPVNVR